MKKKWGLVFGIIILALLVITLISAVSYLTVDTVNDILLIKNISIGV